MKIKQVRVVEYKGKLDQEEYPGDGQWQAQYLHRFEDFRPTPGDFHRVMRKGDGVSGVYVEIEDEGGKVGKFGPLYEIQGFIIQRVFKRFLEGREVEDIELLNEQMTRQDRHGRSGYFLLAVSALDCALWDLKGQIEGRSIASMLCSEPREKHPVYASMLWHSVEPEKVHSKASEIKDQGYLAQKWFFAYGPGSGEEGFQLNMEMAKAARSALGDDYPLMFDAYMGWDVPYAQRMLEALREINPVWVEEVLPPDDLDGFETLARLDAVPLATGEHVYGVNETKLFLDRKLLAYLQNDPDWTGGISTQKQVCDLAKGYGVPVVAHGHSLHPALQIAATRTPEEVPYVEFLIAFQPHKQHFHEELLWPVNGHVTLPDTPGLGIVIDESKVHSSRVMEF